MLDFDERIIQLFNLDLFKYSHGSCFDFSARKWLKMAAECLLTFDGLEINNNVRKSAHKTALYTNLKFYRFKPLVPIFSK